MGQRGALRALPRSRFGGTANPGGPTSLRSRGELPPPTGRSLARQDGSASQPSVSEREIFNSASQPIQASTRPAVLRKPREMAASTRTRITGLQPLKETFFRTAAPCCSTTPATSALTKELLALLTPEKSSTTCSYISRYGSTRVMRKLAARAPSASIGPNSVAKDSSVLMGRTYPVAPQRGCVAAARCGAYGPRSDVAREPSPNLLAVAQGKSGGLIRGCVSLLSVTSCKKLLCIPCVLWLEIFVSVVYQETGPPQNRL